LGKGKVTCRVSARNLVVVALGAYYFFARPQLRKWGTRLGEAQRRLPGDEHIPHPNFETTHAVNIDAPPEAIWPWIAQMGRALTGYYGLDVLKNQGIPSVNFLRQDLEPPQVGQSMDGGFQILAVEPGRLLVFGGFNLSLPLRHHQDVTYAYLLERRRDGSTRLLVRRRGYGYGPLASLFNLGLELLYFAFMFQQLARLKAYGEKHAHLGHH